VPILTPSRATIEERRFACLALSETAALAAAVVVSRCPEGLPRTGVNFRQVQPASQEDLPVRTS
jgi:hypothetical protein